MTSITSHPVEEERTSSEVETTMNQGKGITIGSWGEVTSSSQSQMVPSPLIRAKLVPRRRRLNSRMMIDPQLSERESRIVNHRRRFPEQTKDESSGSSGTYRTSDERSGTYRTSDERIESPRATPLTRFSSSSPSSSSSSGDQSRKPSSSPRQNPSNSPYIFPLSSSSSSPSSSPSSSSPSSNMRTSWNNRRPSGSIQARKKVTPGGHIDKKKQSSKKTEVEVDSEERISSQGVSFNPPEFEEVRNERRNLDMKTIGRLMSNPKKSASLIDLASYRRVSNGQGDPVFYGNDMLFHREPSYENEDNNSRTRNSLSIDPNTEFVLIKK